MLQFGGKIGLLERLRASPGQWSLFVFSISDPKQNARSLLTPVPDPDFHALSNGSLGFALYGSSFNHFLIGQNS